MGEAVTEGGYIRLHRALLEHPIFTQLTPSTLKVWIGCLLRANWRPSKWYDGHAQVEIPAGAFIFSQETLAKLCGVSRKQLRTALEHLQNLQCVATRRASHCSLLIIENWDAYQSRDDREGQQKGHQRANEGPSEGQRRATEEEVKNINTPPTPSQTEGDGACAPLVLTSPDSNEKPKKRTENQRPCQDVLEHVARSIHGRHPNAHGRRDYSATQVEKTLAAILKHQRIPAHEQAAYLERIDRNHAAMCASEAWQKEGGQFVKGLMAWLAVSKERYLVETTTIATPPAAYGPPAGIKTLDQLKAEREQRRREGGFADARLA